MNADQRVVSSQVSVYLL